MDSHDLYRSILTGLACVAIGVNLTLSVIILLHKAGEFYSRVWLAYSATAAATCTVSAYFRLRDAFTALPWNVGDFTALVPILGFLTAGVLGLRTLGRLVGSDHA